jgi:hypothetical protein
MPGGVALIKITNDVTVAKSGETRWQKAALPRETGLKLAVGDRVRTGEGSSATVRLSETSTTQLGALTTLEIRAVAASGKPTLNVLQGLMFLFSREKANEMELMLPTGAAALRGTEFVVRVEPDGRSEVSMLDGEVELSNALGAVTLRNGEQGVIEPGRAPRKTARIDAASVIQWMLYYPAVVFTPDFGLGVAERTAIGASLDAYATGDLPEAWARYPSGHRPDAPNGELYRAAILLAVGQVEEAQKAIAGAPAHLPARRAIEQMIAAVQGRDWVRAAPAQTAGEWLAESYYSSSRSSLG